MPRYSKQKRKKEHKTLKSIHQHARFLGGLREDDWRVFQRAAQNRENQHKNVHAGAYKDLAKGGRLEVLWGLNEEHKARKRGHYVGGGLGDAINSIGKTIWKWGTRPITSAWHAAQNFSYPILHNNAVSEHTNLVASALHQSYVLDENLRADYVGDLIRDQSLSTKYLDVWVDKHRVPPYALISVRGSKEAEDFVVDDVAIAASGRSRNLIETDLKRAVDKYADKFTVEVAGHSLGTALIAESLDSDRTLLSKIDRVDLFNPATSPVVNSVVSDYNQNDKVYYFENQADLVGLGQMLYSSPPKNLTMKAIHSLNPATNHGIGQWMPEKEIETGQLDDSAKENLDNPNAGWQTDPEAFKPYV